MLDKILLILLIILMPVGVIAARNITGSTGTQATQEQIKRIEALVAKLEQTPSSTSATTPPPSAMTILAVNYASTSAVLKISGTAKTDKQAIILMAAVLPAEIIPEINVATDQKAVGNAVTIKAIKPMSGGSFVIDYPVNETAGVLEITLTQGTQTVTIQYDLAKNKRLL